ncbi:MAG: hypothetical protein ACRCZF_25235, partial [Gemmataceae bacterium]
LIRRVARLVKPERPELTFSGIPAGSQIVSPEIGWLTFHIGEKWLDLRVWLEPMVPGGWLRLDFDAGQELAEAAATALNEYYEQLGDAP